MITFWEDGILNLRGTDFLHKLVSMTGQDSNTIVALSEASLVSTIQRYVCLYALPCLATANLIIIFYHDFTSYLLDLFSIPISTF